MVIHFHMAGPNAPGAFHYLMRLDGTLSEQEGGPSIAGFMIIVLEKEGDMPSVAQENALDLMREARPDWSRVFFFQRRT